MTDEEFVELSTEVADICRSGVPRDTARRLVEQAMRTAYASGAADGTKKAGDLIVTAFRNAGADDPERDAKVVRIAELPRTRGKSDA